MHWKEIKDFSLIRDSLIDQIVFLSLIEDRVLLMQFDGFSDRFKYLYIFSIRQNRWRFLSKKYEYLISHWCEIKSPEEELTPKSVCF